MALPNTSDPLSEQDTIGITTLELNEFLGQAIVEDVDNEITIGSQVTVSPTVQYELSDGSEPFVASVKSGLLGQLSAQARLTFALPGVFPSMGIRIGTLLVIEVDFAQAEMLRTVNRIVSCDVKLDFCLASSQAESGQVVIRNYYPRHSVGPIRQTAKQHVAQLVLPNSALGGGGPSYTRTSNSVVEGQHTITARKEGNLDNNVTFVMKENSASKTGLYAKPKLAVVVQHPHDSIFELKVNLRPKSTLAIARTSRTTRSVRFSSAQMLATFKARMSEYDGPFMVAGEKWKPKLHGELPNLDLSNADLERLTRTHAAIVHAQGLEAG